MARYQIWDKQSDIYTPSNERFTAEQWKQRYPWVNIPGTEMIITAGIINGGAAMEYSATVESYRKMGAAITENMTEEEVLAAIEAFEDNPPGANEPTNEERIAAALEGQVLMMSPAEMSGEDETETGNVGASPAYQRIKRNYDRGLWSGALVNAAAAARQINRAEAAEILGA